MRLVVDDDPLVRLRIIKKLPIIATDIPNLCNVLTEHMKNMFVDTNWRIRKELALVMPDILKTMGQDHFCDQFLDQFLVLLKDDVGEVRLASAESLPRLTTSSNATWVQERLFPGVCVCVCVCVCVFSQRICSKICRTEMWGEIYNVF